MPRTSRETVVPSSDQPIAAHLDGIAAPDREHEHLVVTASSGTLRGKRVVRGRETECEEFHDDHKYE